MIRSSNLGIILLTLAAMLYCLWLIIAAINVFASFFSLYQPSLTENSAAISYFIAMKRTCFFVPNILLTVGAILLLKASFGRSEAR